MRNEKIIRRGIRLTRPLAIAGLALMLSGLVQTNVSFGQLPTATILGTIKDTSGAMVPGANITARNVETGQVRTVLSGADGAYRFSALPVGTYEVRVEHSGFQT